MAIIVFLWERHNNYKITGEWAQPFSLFVCALSEAKGMDIKMRNLIRLQDITKEELFDIFERADYFFEHPYEKKFMNRCFVLFFPESSIRTRVTFEKGIYNLGGQSILFDSDTLNKKEAHVDVIGYLNNWVDCIIVRFYDINAIHKIASYSTCPVINGLSDRNHPCEVITDLYSLYKKDKNFLEYHYLYVGPDRNIGYAWKEAADAFGIRFTQCCPEEYVMEGVKNEVDICKAVKGADVVITDSLSGDIVNDFKDYQITKAILQQSDKNIVFNPCPPFYRGQEVSEDAIDSSAFVGYEYKRSLLNVQQAIIDFCIN